MAKAIGDVHRESRNVGTIVSSVHDVTWPGAACQAADARDLRVPAGV
jgi:hypothetical protein